VSFLFLPLADSFLVLMILAAYSWPVQSLTQRRTTEKAPLGNKRQEKAGIDEKAAIKSFVSIKTHISAIRSDLTVIVDSSLPLIYKPKLI